MQGFSRKPPKHLSSGHVKANFNSTADFINVDKGLGTYKIGRTCLFESYRRLSDYYSIYLNKITT